MLQSIIAVVQVLDQGSLIVEMQARQVIFALFLLPSLNVHGDARLDIVVHLKLNSDGLFDLQIDVSVLRIVLDIGQVNILMQAFPGI